MKRNAFAVASGELGPSHLESESGVQTWLGSSSKGAGSLECG